MKPARNVVFAGASCGRNKSAVEAALTEKEIAICLQRAYREGGPVFWDGMNGMTPPEVMTCAAVLIPFVWVEEAWHLVFTRRTDTVEHHKGQVSFPGGGCEVHEGSPEETALREACEEIGLKPEDVRLLGRMNEMATITRYRVTPVIGSMPWPYPLHLAEKEVDRVFTIPLAWLADPKNREERPFTPGGESRPVPVVIYRQYDGETLWGVSGRIVLNLLKILDLA